MLVTILRYPGADSGTEGKSKQTGKNGAKKSKGREEEPLGTNDLNRPVPKGGVRSTSDWCKKTFAFFCPIRRQQAYESFRVFLNGMKLSCSPCSSEPRKGFAGDEKFQSQHKM